MPLPAASANSRSANTKASFRTRLFSRVRRQRSPAKASSTMPSSSSSFESRPFPLSYRSLTLTSKRCRTDKENAENAHSVGVEQISNGKKASSVPETSAQRGRPFKSRQPMSVISRPNSIEIIKKDAPGLAFVGLQPPKLMVTSPTPPRLPADTLPAQSTPLFSSFLSPLDADKASEVLRGPSGEFDDTAEMTACVARNLAEIATLKFRLASLRRSRDSSTTSDLLHFIRRVPVLLQAFQAIQASALPGCDFVTAESALISSIKVAKAAVKPGDPWYTLVPAFRRPSSLQSEMYSIRTNESTITNYSADRKISKEEMLHAVRMIQDLRKRIHWSKRVQEFWRALALEEGGAPSGTVTPSSTITGLPVLEDVDTLEDGCLAGKEEILRSVHLASRDSRRSNIDCENEEHTSMDECFRELDDHVATSKDAHASAAMLSQLQTVIPPGTFGPCLESTNPDDAYLTSEVPDIDPRITSHLDISRTSDDSCSPASASYPSMTCFGFGSTGIVDRSIESSIFGGASLLLEGETSTIISDSLINYPPATIANSLSLNPPSSLNIGKQHFQDEDVSPLASDSDNNGDQAAMRDLQESHVKNIQPSATALKKNKIAESVFRKGLEKNKVGRKPDVGTPKPLVLVQRAKQASRSFTNTVPSREKEVIKNHQGSRSNRDIAIASSDDISKTPRNLTAKSTPALGSAAMVTLSSTSAQMKQGSRSRSPIYAKESSPPLDDFSQAMRSFELIGGSLIKNAKSRSNHIGIMSDSQPAPIPCSLPQFSPASPCTATPNTAKSPRKPKGVQHSVLQRLSSITARFSHIQVQKRASAPPSTSHPSNKASIFYRVSGSISNSPSHKKNKGRISKEDISLPLTDIPDMARRHEHRSLPSRAIAMNKKAKDTTISKWEENETRRRAFSHGQIVR